MNGQIIDDPLTTEEDDVDEVMVNETFGVDHGDCTTTRLPSSSPTSLKVVVLLTMRVTICTCLQNCIGNRFQ